MSAHIQRDTSSTHSWLLIAQAYRHKGDLQKSQAALTNYIQKHGNRADGWFEYFALGKYHQRLGRKEAAQTIYRTVAQMLPDNTEVQDSLRVLSN